MAPKQLETVERSPLFEIAAKPLVEYLVKLHVNDPVHQHVLADLYDMVNEIRDGKIHIAKEMIIRYMAEDDYFSSKEKRQKVFNLNAYIRALQGAVG